MNWSPLMCGIPPFISSNHLSSVLAATSNCGSVQDQAGLWTESGGTKRELGVAAGMASEVDLFRSILTLVLIWILSKCGEERLRNPFTCV